jgi:outer membrane protein OmpA-like peptidoglycan-associated protein
MSKRTRAILAAGAMLLGACASAPKPADLVVLVPDRAGKVGTVVVASARGVATLNEPYAAARVEEGGSARSQKLNEGEVVKIFAPAVAAQPTRPKSFIVYFIEGTDEYTPESQAVVGGFFAEVARRTAPEVTVIGHTDRVGTVEDNDWLSFKRARRVRAGLIEQGVPAESITAAGRGEREPLVPTADEVREPRNRRTEFSVR